MKYLYGDAAEFPEQYNFLETLRAFVECSAKAAALEHEIAQKEQELARQVSADSQEIELVSEFCEGVVEDVKARAEKQERRDAIAPYAEKVIDWVNGHLLQAQATFERESRERRAEAEAEIVAKRGEIGELIGTFLTSSRLAAETASFSMRFVDGAILLGGTTDHRGGISTSFQLDPSKSRFWSQPVKVGHVMPGLKLQVGMRKKFLSKALTPEVVQLDDHTITKVEITPSTCEVHISRRIDPPDDDLVIEMSLVQGQVSARLRVHQGEPQAAEESDMDDLETLWDALEERSQEALAHKHRLDWVRLDGRDVIADGLVMQFVQTLIEQFAPITREVARRSPNEAELSLKLEEGDGVRKELYVRKADLAEPLVDLPDSIRQSFAPLEIFPVLQRPRADED